MKYTAKKGFMSIIIPFQYEELTAEQQKNVNYPPTKDTCTQLEIAIEEENICLYWHEQSNLDALPEYHDCTSMYIGSSLSNQQKNILIAYCNSFLNRI